MDLFTIWQHWRAWLRAMNKPIGILVVDDEPEIRKILTQGLADAGFQTYEAGNKDELFACIETRPVDLITLDISLAGPDDGFDLAREIRATRNIPIIMVTGRAEPVSRVEGLERGADDYVTKPFHIREVVIRVRSVLERYGVLECPNAIRPVRSEVLDRYAFDAQVLDVQKRDLRSNTGEHIPLTDTEFELLEMFLKHPARVLSRDDIWQMLRGRQWSPLERTIDGHIARLRRKIETEGDEPKLIKSVRGVGYVFTGDVRRL